jgi:hypothetical protein
LLQPSSCCHVGHVTLSFGLSLSESLHPEQLFPPCWFFRLVLFPTMEATNARSSQTLIASTEEHELYARVQKP